MIARLRNMKLDAYALLILLNFLIAVGAFFKDVVFAHYFGTSKTADAYTIGFFIPDMIGNNLIASTLGVVCIPVFSLLYKQTTLYKQVIYFLSSMVLVLTVIIASILYSESHAFVNWYASGQTQDVLKETVQSFRFMLPIIIIFPLTLIGVAVLQTEKRFFVPAVAPVVYHVLLLFVLIICTIIGLSRTTGGMIYSLFTTLAALLYLCLVWWGVYRSSPYLKGFFHLSAWKQVSPYIKEIAKGFLPYFFILIASQSLSFVERFFAAHLETGTLAALNFAARLVDFPIAVFVAAITTVLLPDFSRELSLNRENIVIEKMKRVLAITVGLTLMMSLGLFTLRQFIVTILFKRGAFNAHSVWQTVTILKGYSFAIVGQSISLICLRYFLAKRRMLIPLVCFFIGTSTSILIDVFFVPIHGAPVLGYAASIGASLNALLFLINLVVDIRRRL